MYHLAVIIPPARRVVDRLPLSRDQFMLLMAAINQLFLSLDIYLAHSISGSITRYEWIPIIFGAAAGVILLLAGLLALRNRPLATILANLTFLGSIVVGLLGVYFHLQRASVIGESGAHAHAVNLLVWGPPALGPMIFALVGVLGISAAWVEDPPDSGRLRLLGKQHVQMPYSKTRAYFFIVALGALATVISSTLDHARTGYTNPYVWIPVMAGVFATVVAFTLGVIGKPTRADLMTYLAAMILLILVGVVGFALHANVNLVPRGVVVVERFIRGSPLLAPLLFANIGMLGLFVLFNPVETKA